MFVCIYVAIYFRAWYDGCGHENVRIFPGSAPGPSRDNFKRCPMATRSTKLIKMLNWYTFTLYQYIFDHNISALCFGYG